MSAEAKPDFFVSYNRHDKTWAEWIAWILEAAGYTVVIEAWDFRPGGNFVVYMQQAAAQAERTIAVLSQHYLDGKFTHPEWAAAFAQDPTGEKRSLLPIRVGECLLTGLLASIVYVDLVGVEEEAGQALVLQAVQAGRTKPEQKPSFPGRSAPMTDRPKPVYPPNILQNLPYGSTNFVGREVELEQIHAQLQARSTVAISALSGMGGIGKTELALQYARQHCREGSYPGGLCWVRAREDVSTQIISFVRSCLELVPPDDLELAEKVRWCWGRWREGAALLIFDDVQQYEDIAPFLPPQESRFKVLLTTRSHFGASVREIQLEVLSEAKALELLQSLVERDRPDLRGFENLGGLETAKQICEWLGYLPLGIELVGRYLARKPDTSLATLWQRLQDKRLDAIAFKQAEPGMTASLGVAAAFELSWQTLDASAQQVAAVLSLFALVEIPWTLVEQCLPAFDAEELEELRDRQLLGTHLLKRVDQGMYQLHQLLREFFAAKRSQRTDETALQQAFYEVVIAEAERVFDKPERSLMRESTITLSHLKEANHTLERLPQDADLAACSFWIARLCWKQGRYSEAELHCCKALEIRQQIFGDNHRDSVQSLSDLSVLRQSQGRYSEGESLCRQALKIRQQLFKNAHPDVAQSLNNLSLYCILRGLYAEAEALLLEALEIWQQQLGHDHADVAIGLSNLANLYDAQRRYGEVELFSKQSLEIRQRLLGNHHPDVALSLNNLAILHWSQGRCEEAELLLVRALEIWQRQLGDDHPTVATSLSNLARFYRSQARYSDSESLFLQSLSILQNQLSAEHPSRARVVSGLAHLYESQGRFRESESLYLQSLPILSAKFAENHQWRQEASQNFCALLQKAIQEQRTDELSDDPMTQAVLRELEEGGGV